MWEPHVKLRDALTGTVWAALLCTLFTEYTSSTRSEIYVELLCWIILPTFFRTMKYNDLKSGINSSYSEKNATQYRAPGSWWIVALSIAFSCAYKTENRVIQVFPILTPVLLLLQRRLQTDSFMTTIPVSIQTRGSKVETWKVAAFSSFAMLALASRDYHKSMISIIPTAAVLPVYVALIPRRKTSTSIFPVIIDENSVSSLSSWVVFMLLIGMGLESCLFGFSLSNAIAAIAPGIGKALSWVFLIRIAQQSSVAVAAAIQTFSIVAMIDLSVLSTHMEAIFCISSTLFAIGQIIYMLPRQMKYKQALWLLPLLVLVPYMGNIVAINSLKSAAQLSFDGSHSHPVEAIMNSAKEGFENMRRMQSQSYIAAHDEYVRRYGVEPPPGFQAWYEFAVSHNSPVIDEFDTMTKNILPFLQLSGKEIMDTMNLLQSDPRSETWDCTFSAREAQTSCAHSYRSWDRHISWMFDTLLGDLQLDVPSIRFFVNHLDEPRVVVPSQLTTGEHHRDQWLNLTDLSHQPVYKNIIQSCEPYPIRREIENSDSLTFGLPFVTNSSSAMDLCQHPEYERQHGLIMSPVSFNLIQGLIPVLSTGTLSAMADILYPSPAYLESEFQYEERYDIPWDQKVNKLYWAGSTTGGFATDDSWRSYHRQRFISLGQNLGYRQHSYLQTRDGYIQRIKSSILDRRLFDVSFTRIFQCTWKQCKSQRNFFSPKSWAHKDEAFRSKLVFDIDGNGISGRYYKLLASKSTPLKQTLLKEWHDDRLIPWVHYIPVSQSMDELPELVLYLTSTQRGRQRAQEIAEQGHEWFRKCFRTVDFSIYTYRLLLELARLQDPAREAIQF
ncbi:glycosyltransferase family 90 protein [Trichoderma austrokoningii]